MKAESAWGRGAKKRQHHEIFGRFSLRRVGWGCHKPVAAIVVCIANKNAAMGPPGPHPGPGLGNEPSADTPFLQGRFNGDGAKSKPALVSALMRDRRQRNMTDDPVVQFSHQGEAKRTPIAQGADQVLFVTGSERHGRKGPPGEIVDRRMIPRRFWPDQDVQLLAHIQSFRPRHRVQRLPKIGDLLPIPPFIDRDKGCRQTVAGFSARPRMAADRYPVIAFLLGLQTMTRPISLCRCPAYFWAR